MTLSTLDMAALLSLCYLLGHWPFELVTRGKDTHTKADNDNWRTWETPADAKEMSSHLIVPTHRQG